MFVSHGKYHGMHQPTPRLTNIRDLDRRLMIFTLILIESAWAQRGFLCIP